jgi:signal transduction histidine kinase
MTRQRIQYGLLALGAAVIFIVLFVHAQRIVEDEHNRYRTDLRQLEGLHAVLNENVLRAKLGLLTYYDPLNRTLSEIDDVRGRLGQVPAFVDEQGQREIGTSLADYDRLQAKKRDLVEHFKTQNSVLVNSLSYFTIVVSELIRNTGASNSDPALVAKLNSLLQDVLLYNTSSNPALVPHIQEQIEALRQGQITLDAASRTSLVDLDVLISHTNIIIKRKPVVDGMINEMFGLPISTQISSLASRYDDSYEIARRETNLYQIGLYIFSLLVVAYIAASIISRLRRSAVVVSRAREELQVTYSNLEKQSAELQLANSQLMKATREAREASRLKDEFLAVMSHELRTPLNAIIGFQGILLLAGTLDERTLHMIRRAQANAERLLALINDILDISRIEAGRMQLTPVDVPIAQAIDTWRNQMSVLAEQKGLKFSVHVDESMPEIIRADQDAITKIVTNLLGNAFKFTEKGEVALNLTRRNGNWLIGVSDTGIGIPAHMQQVIFERFRQVDGSAKRKYGGSGLGLAIVYNLCKAMNGTVVVQSAPNEGSTFTVTLPLETAPEGKYADG